MTNPCFRVISSKRLGVIDRNKYQKTLQLSEKFLHRKNPKKNPEKSKNSNKMRNSKKGSKKENRKETLKKLKKINKDISKFGSPKSSKSKS